MFTAKLPIASVSRGFICSFCGMLFIILSLSTLEIYSQDLASEIARADQVKLEQIAERLKKDPSEHLPVLIDLLSKNQPYGAEELRIVDNAYILSMASKTLFLLEKITGIPRGVRAFDFELKGDYVSIPFQETMNDSLSTWKGLWLHFKDTPVAKWRERLRDEWLEWFKGKG